MGPQHVQDLGPEGATRQEDRKFAAHASLKELNTDSEGVFTGYAAVTGNVDRGNDRIDSGAFSQTLNQNGGKVPILMNHQGGEWIGNNREAREDDKGLFVRGKLMVEENQKAREVHSVLKDAQDNGQRAGLSVGFTIPEGKTEFHEQENGDMLRVIKEVRLLEYSVAPVPMNPEAAITDVKQYMPDGEHKSVVDYQKLPLAGEERSWSANAAESRVREWAGGPDKEDIDWSRYRKAFLWYDTDNKTNFGAYKLPIADVVSGTLRAVPRGIFAAAATVQGARGGVDIPDSDLESVRNHLSRYYERLDATPPWQEEDAMARDVAVARGLLYRHGIDDLRELPQAGSPDTSEARKALSETLEGFAQALN